MNGDSLIASNLEKLISYLDIQEVGCVILGMSVNDTSRYGSLIFDDSNNLLRFSEKENGQGLINGGIYLFRHKILEYFPSFNLKKILFLVLSMIFSQRCYNKILRLKFAKFNLHF